MTFNPNIPSTGNRINQQYTLIQTNFNQSNILYALDHYAWNDASPVLRGLHRKLTLIQQAAMPAAVANAGIIATIDNPSAGVTRTDAYYEYNSGGIGNSQIAPLVPFKVFGVITLAGALVAGTSLNVGVVGMVQAGSRRTYTISFTNKLSDALAGTALSYGVFVSISSTAGNPSDADYVYRNTLNNSVQIVILDNAISYSEFSFGIIQV